MKNRERIQKGAESVAPYIENQSNEEALTDCLANLMHWAHDAREDFQECLDRARMHFIDELEE